MSAPRSAVPSTAADRPLFPRGAVYLAAASLGFAACVWVVSLRVYWPQIAGVDPQIMRELGRRWLDSGTMYLPYQLAGPYSVDVTADLSQTPALYPPAAGPLFALWSLAPAWLLPLWWAVPVAAVAWCVRSWRPAPWSWPLLALCLAGPNTPAQFIAGGTTLWLCAFVALGLRRGGWGALVLVKPTLAPFALAGVNSRWWWAAAAAVAALTLAGPWRDYLLVVQNASQSGNGLMYSLGSVPLLLLPAIAWAARRER